MVLNFVEVSILVFSTPSTKRVLYWRISSYLYIMEAKLTEGKIQSIITTHFHNLRQETRYCLWHVPNGGDRDGREANTLLAEGVVSGIEDLHLFWDSKMYFFEIKTDDGVVSPPQKAAHAAHANQGSPTYLIRDPYVCISIIEAIIDGKSLESFKSYISPFAKPEMLQTYSAEAIAYKAKRKAQTKARSTRNKTSRSYF